MIFSSVCGTQSAVNWFPFCHPHRLCLLSLCASVDHFPVRDYLPVSRFSHPATHIKVLLSLGNHGAFSSCLISLLPEQVKHSDTRSLALFKHFCIFRLFSKHSASLLIISKVYANHLLHILPLLMLSTILRIDIVNIPCKYIKKIGVRF